MDRSDWPKIVAAMHNGGYYDNVMSGGPALDRVKVYLRAFAYQGTADSNSAGPNPAHPCFPGLRHAPFHDPTLHPAVALLERAFDVIRSEAILLGDEDPFEYTAGSLPWARQIKRLLSPLRPKWKNKRWSIYPFFHMGVDVEALTQCAPRTAAIVRTLPGACLDYPWGDAIFSIQGPGNRLPAHCSVDNLRLRCHLGLRIPADTGIRVATESRTWTEGKCLLFEDCFEHEVWNHSDSPRVVLIVDLWHPDLTDIEIRALTAGFRKVEVRRVFMHKRIRQTNAANRYVAYLDAETSRQETDPLLREYWRY